MMDVAFEEPQLRIVLHTGDVLHAPVYGVKCMSACACNLPADAAEWDLSGLLIDGQPVSLSIVKAWLGAVYKQLGDGQYAEDLHATSRTMEGLYQLLRFADAVSSRQGVVQACLAHVEALIVHIPYKDHLVPLFADGSAYSFGVVRGTHRLIHELTSQEVCEYASEDSMDAALQVLATQLEQLLWVAHKMQLAPLISALHTFIHSTVATSQGVLRGFLGRVLTARVQKAALGPGRTTTTTREWINSIVTQPAAVAEHQQPHQGWLLQPLDNTEDLWHFDARLTRRYLGMPAGTKVEVHLDLSNGCMPIDGTPLSMQLLLGPAMLSEYDHSLLMGC